MSENGVADILARRCHWQSIKSSDCTPQTIDFLSLCPSVWPQLPVWTEAEMKPAMTMGLPAGEAAEVNVVRLKWQSRRRWGLLKKSDRFPWPFSKELGTDLHSLKVSSLLSSFPSSFRLYVQRILFICQPFQRTKHCSALCNIYQRAESSMGLGFGLELGLTVFSLSQTHYPLQGTHPLFLSCPVSVFVSLVVYHFHPFFFGTGGLLL